MTDRRFSSWKEDDFLSGELQKYVKQGLKREEAIYFLWKDFLQFAWSNRTLDERLRHFEVYCKDDTISVEKMLKRLLKRNWKTQVSYWGILRHAQENETKYDLLVLRCNVWSRPLFAEKARRKKGDHFRLLFMVAWSKVFRQRVVEGSQIGVTFNGGYSSTDGFDSSRISSAVVLR